MSEVDLRSVFTRTMWPGGFPETISGKGSTIAATERVRAGLTNLIRDHDIRSIVDAGCGDFNWMRIVDLNEATYVGLELQDDVATHNQQRYGMPGRVSFQACDVTRHPLPSADLLICRDVMIHLTYADHARFFSNILRSAHKLLLLASYRNETNTDLWCAGKARQVNLSAPPYRLRPALMERRIPDWAPGHDVKWLHLYRSETIRPFLERAIVHLERAAEEAIRNPVPRPILKSG